MKKKISDLIDGKKLNINEDTDGILSYLILKLGGLNVNIGGFNNSSNIILNDVNDIHDMWYNNCFIDIFSPKENVFTIDQHIIGLSGQNFEECKINPHTIIENHHALDYTYFKKYPFSTCLFILSILERENRINNEIDLFKPLKKYPELNICDMILRADSSSINALTTQPNGKKGYRENVKEWADKMISFSNNGINTKNIFTYLLNSDEKVILSKINTINRIYKGMGLKENGECCRNVSIKFNLNILLSLLKTFSKYFEIDLNEEEKSFYIFEGKAYRSNDIENFKFENVDTYAFIFNNMISYTKNIIPTNKYEKVLMVQ